MSELPATVLLPLPPTDRRFSAERTVRLGDVDPLGELRLDAVARYLQDVAGDDAVDSGLSNAVGWVVRRTMIRIDRPSRVGCGSRSSRSAPAPGGARRNGGRRSPTSTDRWSRRSACGSTSTPPRVAWPGSATTSPGSAGLTDGPHLIGELVGERGIVPVPRSARGPDGGPAELGWASRHRSRYALDRRSSTSPARDENSAPLPSEPGCRARLASPLERADRRVVASRRPTSTRP